MKTDIDISLLEKYLAGEISREEVLDLEGNQVSESVLEQGIRNLEDITLGLQVMAFKEDLKEISNQVGLPEKPSNSWLKYAGAAAVLVLAVAAFIIVSSNQQPKFEKYFTHFENLSTSRADNSDKVQEAMKFYAIKDFDQSLSILKSIPETQLTGESYFYAGISAMAVGDFELALRYLKSAENKSPSEFSEPIRWYKALTLWQLDEVKTAKKLLLQIKTGEYQYDRATSLLNALDD